MVNKRYVHSEDGFSDHRTLVITVAVLVVLTVSFWLVVRGQLQKHFSVHRISGTSMMPTLTEEDQVLVKKNSPIQRYDMIAFSVDGETGLFVKRVIGLPGDRLFVQNDRMILNIGEHGEFDTTSTFQLTPTVAEAFQSLNQIPAGAYFVIGDHVEVSKDSRAFGLVKKQAIEGTIQFHFPAARLAGNERKEETYGHY